MSRNANTVGGVRTREGVRDGYADVFTSAAMETIAALAPLDAERTRLMRARLERRAERRRSRTRIAFLDPDAVIAGTGLRVGDAREGRFDGSPIPRDLERQWIQGTGPATRPRSTIDESLRSVAYALLSGADGWMFDGEDALGQVDTMSLDNQRHLALAFAGADPFLRVAERVAHDMNTWSRDFLGRSIVEDWRAQLDVTTRIFRPRGLHLDDRHVGLAGGDSLGASIVDAALYVTLNHTALRQQGRSIVLYLPKIQRAEEAAWWRRMLDALEHHLALPADTIKAYVLVEQVEAAFQLMEIRAALGGHFVGYNTGRWDYINSVSDAASWDPDVVNPNIDAITMTYGYMRAYEDRVRRAVNTPDRNGRCALWQGGMEANIPVGSPAGIQASLGRARAGAEREQREGASGKWVAHWKMVHVIRPVWEQVGAPNQLGRAFPPLTYTDADARALFAIEPAPRTLDGARDLVSVALQYGSAFGRGYQAAALKPADAFGNDDILYLMEDMATGEIRLSILWEWIHKHASLTAHDERTGASAGDAFTAELCARVIDEEFAKLQRAGNRDVHDDSKLTSLPIARAIVETYLAQDVKCPWYVDLLNITLGSQDLATARGRIDAYVRAYTEHGTRLTHNPEFA